jgi:peptidoglycan/LPS O-acetylase OafA/YrhL
MTKVDEFQVIAVKQQLDALTGLRIVAAMWVFLHHFSDVIFGLLPALLFLEPLFDRGGAGVDLFFMLSGFILAYTYLARLGAGVKGTSYVGFIRLRIARVYPVHIATLLSSLVLMVGASFAGVQVGGTVHTPWALVQNLLLVQAWFNQPYSWNGVAWSVSAEWFVYLAFPLVAVLIIKVRCGWRCPSLFTYCCHISCSLALPRTVRRTSCSECPPHSSPGASSTESSNRSKVRLSCGVGWHPRLYFRSSSRRMLCRCRVVQCFFPSCAS